MSKHNHPSDIGAGHPDDEQILAYVKAPEAESSRALRRHLASCRFCRRRTELVSVLRQYGHWLPAQPVSVEPEMSRLMNAQTDAAELERIRRQIKQDPQKLRAALHYASHAQAMETLKTPRVTASWLNRLGETIDRLRHYQLPVWKAAPALLLLALVTGLTLQTLDEDDSAGQLVAFNDSPGLIVISNESRPGIGFFNQQPGARVEFEGVKTEWLAPNRLRFSWPEIETALSYQFKLQVFRQGESRVIARRELSQTRLEIELEQALTRHRYEWVLSGDLADNRSFQASGGFVISGGSD